jgi:cob(I)alamin adenosyltransferase
VIFLDIRGSIMDKSFLQVYMGEGKGKTTAAIGLAVRAAGRGLNVRIARFLKGRESGEIYSLLKIDNIELIGISECSKFFDEMTGEEKQSMRNDVSAALPLIESWLGKADVVVLDEALGALQCGILKMDELIKIIDSKGGTEIVLTGRNAPEAIIKRAGLVTEMKEIKHYYNEGVTARRGIEY